MGKPKLEEFSCNKIQRLKNGGLKIGYTALYPMGETKIERKSDESFEIAPVDDFLECLHGLKRYVATCIHFGKLNSVIGDEKFKITKEQSSYLTKLYNSWMQKLTINSVQIFTDGELVTNCIISYSMEGYNGQSMDCKTYKIDLDDGEHGWETELSDLCDELIQHAYNYIFEGVGTVIELFDDKQKDGQEDEINVEN